MPGGVSGTSNFQAIFNALFPEKLEGKSRNRSIRDALHIDQAILNECDYFLTHETRLIDKSKISTEINNQLIVLTPEDAVIEIQNYFSNNYGTSELLSLKEISESSGPIILGSNSCYSFSLTDNSSGKTILKCEINDGLLELNATFFNESGIPALVIEPNMPTNFTDNTFSINCGGIGGILISKTKCNHFSISSKGKTNLSARLTHFGKVVFYRASLRGMDERCNMSIYGHTLSIQGMSLS